MQLQNAAMLVLSISLAPKLNCDYYMLAYGSASSQLENVGAVWHRQAGNRAWQLL